MDEAAPAQDGDPSDSSHDPGLPPVVTIVPSGDVVLDVTFETSRETLKSTRKATRPRPGHTPVRPVLKPTIRLAYRVDVDVLKKQSKYFNNLLGDTRFQEAKTIVAAFKDMSLRNVKAAELQPRELPWISIDDDDEATRAAGRETVFADMLRILHGKETAARPATMLYVTTLAVLADRFDCTKPVSRALSTDLKFKWPAAQVRSPREDGSRLSLAAEEVLRQKILVSWLLDQPLKLHAASRELILRGSSRWSVYEEADDVDRATWWDLQDDLERELQYRRECILNTIASVQRHFLALYSSRERQCKLGYDSSTACDSYQLGEMVRFLAHRNLLFLVDFSPGSLLLGSVPADQLALLDVGGLLGTLRQCPGYQIDKNHTNCGLRTRILPILEYVQAMLSSNVVSVSRKAWDSDRAATTWIPSEVEEDDGRSGEERSVFRFTRSVMGDQRLRYEGAMAADRLARELFTAQEWDWTADG